MGNKAKTSKQQSLAGASDQLLNDALSDISGLFGGGDSQADTQAPREGSAGTPEAPAEKVSEQAPSSGGKDADAQVASQETAPEASAESSAEAKQSVAQPTAKSKVKRRQKTDGDEDACLVPLPPKRPAKEERAAMLIRVPVEDKAAVEQMAEERGLSVSAFCAAILHAIVQQARKDT